APGAAPRLVGHAARAFAWSPHGELAFAGRDVLGIGGKTVALSALQAISWSPDGRRVAARTSAASGGTLWTIDPLSGTAQKIAVATSDFAFASDGALAALGPPPSKGGDRPLLVDGRPIATATAFAFAPDGSELALFSTEKQPGEAAGDLYRMPRSGGLPRVAATRVIDWRWGAGGDLLCLARYDLRARAGTLTAIGPGGAAREIAAKVQSFSVFGPRLLYVVQAPQKGDFKLELWGIDLAPPRGAPRAVDVAVISAAGSPMDRLKPLAEEVDPTSRFADDAGKHVVYAIVAAGRSGVFLADVP